MRNAHTTRRDAEAAFGSMDTEFDEIQNAVTADPFDLPDHSLFLDLDDADEMLLGLADEQFESLLDAALDRGEDFLTAPVVAPVLRLLPTVSPVVAALVEEEAA